MSNLGALNPFGQSVPVRLSWEENGTIYVLPFDACLLETHTLASNVSNHPVESGASVQDHITDEPERVSISGVWSNTPLLKLADAFAALNPLSTSSTEVTLGANPLEPRRAETLFDRLDKLRLDRQLVTLYANLRAYESMAILSITVPRDAARGGGVFLDLELQKITEAQSQTVAVDVKPPDKYKTKTKGKKPKKPATAPQEQKQQSLLSVIARRF